jgi:uncharacterized protein YgiM (DUF1202 family)
MQVSREWSAVGSSLVPEAIDGRKRRDGGGRAGGAESVHAPGVAKVAGYETPATTYIVANSTNVYRGPALVDTEVTGQLKRGDHVEVLAKVKGWEWALVGKDGTGIGYVTISMRSPADKYVP